ncbi:MAG: ABC transporter ATP-binding protein [Deltaproteobacteria bacterium]|nr:ABC transporter ATP-binding protein [Deltaproteobacteria bacterium]
MGKNILEVKELKTYFFTRRGVVKAVDGLSFTIEEGETLGLVGESGCGKSITCLSILRLVPKPAGRIVAGEILMNGDNLLAKTDKEMRQVRGKQISMILQEPMTSLNPVFTIGNQVAEPIKLHQKLDRKAVWEKVKEMLSLVKIPSPEVRIREYPHQMSGGMRQRIVGAMTLSCQPQLLIADEPTTALDVTIQAQFLKLLKDIQRDSKLTMIVVTHDFGIVARVCDRVAVMYAGKVVENAPIRDLFNNPRHPYTIALMESLPKMEKKADRLFSIEGQPPDLRDLPPGCRFAPRCPQVKEICQREFPPQSVIGDRHSLSCWLAS